MKIIAKRKSSIGLLYFFTLLLGFLVLSIGSQDTKSVILGIVVVIVSVFILIHFCITPKIAIEQDEKGNFYFSMALFYPLMKL